MNIRYNTVRPIIHGHLMCKRTTETNSQCLTSFPRHSSAVWPRPFVAHSFERKGTKFTLVRWNSKVGKKQRSTLRSVYTFWRCDHDHHIHRQSQHCTDGDDLDGSGTHSVWQSAHYWHNIKLWQWRWLSRRVTVYKSCFLPKGGLKWEISQYCAALQKYEVNCYMRIQSVLALGSVDPAIYLWHYVVHVPLKTVQSPRISTVSVVPGAVLFST